MTFKVPGLTDHPGPQSCPRIEADFNEILIPSAREKHIAVRAINLQVREDYDKQAEITSWLVTISRQYYSYDQSTFLSIHEGFVIWRVVVCGEYMRVVYFVVSNMMSKTLPSWIYHFIMGVNNIRSTFLTKNNLLKCACFATGFNCGGW